jgi:hypothetical protein
MKLVRWTTALATTAASVTLLAFSGVPAAAHRDQAVNGTTTDHSRAAGITASLLTPHYARLVWRKADQNLYMMTGNAQGGWQTGAERIGTDWGDASLLTSAGDFSGDSAPDVIWRKGDGHLYMLEGGSQSVWKTGTPIRIGTDWGDASELISPGDFSGDGGPDLIWRKGDGHLYMLEGNGRGGWKTGRPIRIGTDWADASLLTEF